MSPPNQFLGQVSHDSFRAAVELRRNAFEQGRDLGDAKWAAGGFGAPWVLSPHRSKGPIFRTPADRGRAVISRPRQRRAADSDSVSRRAPFAGVTASNGLQSGEKRSGPTTLARRRAHAGGYGKNAVMTAKCERRLRGVRRRSLGMIRPSADEARRRQAIGQS